MANLTARPDSTRQTLLAAALLLGTAGAAGATTIVVNTAVDSREVDGMCSLREAIIAANTNVQIDTCAAGVQGFDTVRLSAAGPFFLSLGGSGEDAGLEGDLDIHETITIEPAADGLPRVIDAQGLDRVLHVHAVFGLRLRQIEIRGGRVIDGSGGGGIRIEPVDANLRLEDVEVRDNVAEVGAGGGILVLGGELTLTRAVVAGNRAGVGGGLDVGGAAILDGALVSIADNRATTGGGGLRHHSTAASELTDSAIVDNGPSSLARGPATLSGGGIQLLAGELTLENVTVSGNAADRGGGIEVAGSGMATLVSVTLTANRASDGGGLFGSFGSGPVVILRNTILAGNAASDIGPDCFGNLESQGHNLIGSTSLCTLLDCGAGAACGHLLDVDPQLTGRGLYGGSTPTHLLLDDSPALDAGDPGMPGSGGTTCASVDQRHEPRPVDGDGDLVGRCDMGAVEMQAPLLPILVDGFESGDTSRW